MKNKFLLAVAAMAFFATSCNKSNDDAVDTNGGDESVISLTIYDSTPKVTKAAGADTDATTAAESNVNVADGLKVVVYNEDGSLAYPTGGDPVELTLTNIAANQYKSGQFTVNSGNKYFYVFANDAADVITPAASRTAFITQTIASTLSAGDVLSLSNPNFLMGTLWSDKVLAPGGGTATTPKTVNLSIGRLASKVTLDAVAQGTSNMNGTFDVANAKYRLGSIAKSIFVVGNNDESLATPPATGHGVVTSAVHTQPYPSAYPSTAFERYTNTWKVAADSFYASENTTKPDVNGMQYYGNTTYIQIETVYTPAVSEVYNVDDLLAAGSFTGPTFYTAKLISNGDVVIFEKDPRTAAGNNPNADIDQTSVKVYTDGKNYHKFPVYDKSVNDVMLRNAVLRNHSYRYSVTNILNLGSPESEVDPEEPIETPTTIVVEVEVLPWSKIEDNDVTIG